MNCTCPLVGMPYPEGADMVIKLSPELEAALNESARRQGVSPDVLANSVLRERFLAPSASFASPG